MVAMQALSLMNNSFVGTVPESWGSWQNATLIALSRNAGLTGCVPRTWEGLLRALTSPPRPLAPSATGDTAHAEVDNILRQVKVDAKLVEVNLQYLTSITGYC
jgi:hypothetical protein